MTSDAPRSPRRRPAARRARSASWLVAGALAVLTLWGLTPWDAFTPAAQLVALRPLVLVACVIGCVLALFLRTRLAAAALAALAAVSIAVWMPAYVGTRLAPAAHGGTLQVLSVNALAGQADAAQIVEEVEAERVDVLVIVELTDSLVTRLAEAGLDAALPHAHLLPTESGPAGSGLWTRAQQSAPGAVSGTTLAMPHATIDAAGCPLRVTAVHPFPPLDVGRWADELAAVGRHLRSGPTPQVAAGDFNASRDHASFRRLLGDRFEDAAWAAGAGWQPTWPQGLGPVTDLDHVVVDAGMTASDVRTIPVEGSDHRAVLATLHLPPAAC